MLKTEFYSPNSIDYIHVALAIGTLAYHDKNYLSSKFQDNAKISEAVQSLLMEYLNRKDS